MAGRSAELDWAIMVVPMELRHSSYRAPSRGHFLKVSDIRATLLINYSEEA